MRVPCGAVRSWAGDYTRSSLFKLAPYVNVVCLSFMQPDTTYSAASGTTFAGTGLQFSSNAEVRAA